MPFQRVSACQRQVIEASKLYTVRLFERVSASYSDGNYLETTNFYLALSRRSRKIRLFAGVAGVTGAIK